MVLPNAPAIRGIEVQLVIPPGQGPSYVKDSVIRLSDRVGSIRDDDSEKIKCWLPGF
jgi:hypothetical protein